MSMKLFEMKQELRQAISKKETLLEDARAAGGRSMTDSERADYQAAFSKELELKAQINEREAMSTIRQFDPVALMDGSAVRKGGQSSRRQRPKECDAGPSKGFRVKKPFWCLDAARCGESHRHGNARHRH